MAQLAGHHVQVLVDAYDLTGDSNSLSITDTRLALDATTFGDAVRHYILGQRKINLEHSGFVNAEAAQSHQALSGVAMSGVVSLILGQNAAPMIGDPMYSLLSQQESYSVLPQYANLIPFTARFSHHGAVGGWGQALAVPIAFSTNTNGAVLDAATDTNNGGAAFLHVLAADDDPDYTLTIKGATNAEFSAGVVTVASFNFSGNITVGSQRVSAITNIPRYLRWEAVGTQGTVMLAVNFIRF